MVWYKWSYWRNFSLSPKERAEVTRAVVEAVDGKVPVVSGIAVEGIQGN